jgi:hypothetical protein
MFSTKQAPQKKMETKDNTAVLDPEPQVAPSMRCQIKPDPEPQVAQQIPPATSEVTQQVPTNCPVPESQVSQQIPIACPGPGSQVTSSMHHPNPSICRPIPSRSSSVQAFQQILAQQNETEYVNVSSGDEDDNS